MGSATKAGFGDTLLGFNPSCTSYFQGTLGRVCSFPRLVSACL